MRLKWPGFNESGSVTIELAPGSFCLAKNEIDLIGEIFTPKDELHVTLIGRDLGLIIQDTIQLYQAINQLLEKTFEEIDWAYKQTGPGHILLRPEEGVIQKSVIMLIEMPGLTVFYDQLKFLGLLDLETPIPATNHGS